MIAQIANKNGKFGEAYIMPDIKTAMHWAMLTIKDRKSQTLYLTGVNVYQQEKDDFLYAVEEYILIDDKFILIYRFVVNEIEDEIERYIGDYINPRYGRRFKNGDIVTLNKYRYPEAVNKLFIVTNKSDMIDQKNDKYNTNNEKEPYTLKYWNNYCALMYINNDNNEPDYYSYDMVHEQFIEKENDQFKIEIKSDYYDDQQEYSIFDNLFSISEIEFGICDIEIASIFKNEYDESSRLYKFKKLNKSIYDNFQNDLEKLKEKLLNNTALYNKLCIYSKRLDLLV